MTGVPWIVASIHEVTCREENFKSLIAQADANNGDLKIAGPRVLEARAQLGHRSTSRTQRV
ncbi:hypothetical protein CUJ87_28655 [Paraburkholderia caledonica]|nr:hypothetical protein CUJ87_28655 [Paraburkholderia caledonica]